MYDAHAVAVLNGRDELREKAKGLFLRESTSFLKISLKDIRDAGKRLP